MNNNKGVWPSSCDICGKRRGANHDKCAKIRKKKYGCCEKKNKKLLNEHGIEFIIKNTAEK